MSPGHLAPWLECWADEEKAALLGSFATGGCPEGEEHDRTPAGGARPVRGRRRGLRRDLPDAGEVRGIGAETTGGRGWRMMSEITARTRVLRPYRGPSVPLFLSHHPECGHAGPGPGWGLRGAPGRLGGDGGVRPGAGHERRWWEHHPPPQGEGRHGGGRPFHGREDGPGPATPSGSRTGRSTATTPTWRGSPGLWRSFWEGRRRGRRSWFWGPEVLPGPAWWP